MAEENFDEIRKLPLKERLEKLKELEEKRKKELDETSKLLKESLDEDRKRKAFENVEVPESEPIEISDLFKIKGQELEAVIAREAPPKVDEETVKYELMLDYKLLSKIAEEKDGGKLKDALYKVQDRINNIASKMDYSNMSKDVANQLVITRSVLYNMKKNMGL